MGSNYNPILFNPRFVILRRGPQLKSNVSWGLKAALDEIAFVGVYKLALFR